MYVYDIPIVKKMAYPDVQICVCIYTYQCVYRKREIVLSIALNVKQFIGWLMRFTGVVDDFDLEFKGEKTSIKYYVLV